HWSIPPDIDDTCCVSFLLAKHGHRVPSNHAVILANRDPRKLFYTWFIPRWPMPRSVDYWRVALPQAIAFRRFVTFFRTTYASLHDVDCVVNANALLYLGESAELQPVVDYLIESVRAGREGACDKWYQRPFALYYALSRAYFNGVS